MSIVFVPKKLRGKAKINQETIQRMVGVDLSHCLCLQSLLDENDQLVRCITEYMQKGRAVECVQYQQILHRNIVYLATIADASPDSGAPATDAASHETSAPTAASAPAAT
uniref:Ss18, like 2 n=1 Tax=Gasterosteus aculeatus aculeatus TaxID=481459 RepID=G3PQ00_GASAC